MTDRPNRQLQSWFAAGQVYQIQLLTGSVIPAIIMVVGDDGLEITDPQGTAGFVPYHAIAVAVEGAPKPQPARPAVALHKPHR